MPGNSLSNTFINGILHKGNGENLFLTQQPAVISSIMGNGRRRSITCPSCSGLADGNKLLAPVALAAGIDGSLYIGDLNFVRRVFPSMNTTNILELSNNPAHKYFLAVDPVTGALYVSDTNSRRIYRMKSLMGSKQLSENSEVVAGTGEQCLPFDEARCGDGGKAVEATLMSPRGIAVDKNGLMYFVDATMIRKVDQNGIISTLLGSNDLTAVRPLSCDSSMDVSQVRLEWPTDLAINPMDNSLYVLENNVILRITENHQVSIIAGRPMHCQVPGIDYSLSKLAIHSALESATSIAMSHTGVLYIAETDEKKMNRVRQVTTNGEISLLAGKLKMQSGESKEEKQTSSAQSTPSGTPQTSPKHKRRGWFSQGSTASLTGSEIASTNSSIDMGPVEGGTTEKWSLFGPRHVQKSTTDPGGFALQSYRGAQKPTPMELMRAQATRLAEDPANLKPPRMDVPGMDVKRQAPRSHNLKPRDMNVLTPSGF
ncbi:Teneurin-2 [Acipenser ruthenus]|uniref:Teneurin-2 n=1 Tax=Acipenser ruthenus TaxID=7906 RepID=A0A662YK12_ACIRT|nr:Teneurin-2 [Acipenser ruthenus]